MARKTKEKINLDSKQNTIFENSDILNIELQSNYYLLTITNEGINIKSDDMELSSKKKNLELHTKLHFFKILKGDSGFTIITNNTELEISSNSQPLKISKNETCFEISVSITSFVLQYENNSLKFLDIPENDFALNSNCDNNCLIISEIKKKIYLPYTISELENKYQNGKSKYTSLSDLIEQEYVVPMEHYRHQMIARFREGYKLIKQREKGSLKNAIDLGLELMFRANLNPAIITACKNLKELDIYLDCLEENELDNFYCFKIIYQMTPATAE